MNILAASTAASTTVAGLWPASLALWQREMVRFFRQRNRVIGALGTPVVFWLLLGAGLDKAFVVQAAAGAEADATGGIGYMQFLFPGTLTMILLFTAIFSTFSVIEDRREGFMQAVLVAPVPRLAIVLGKVLGGASIATIQGVVFLLLWPLIGPMPAAGALLMLLPLMFALAAGLTALGLCLAWPMDSTAAFHAMMNLFLLPMWFLSGALFPVQSAAPWLQVVMYANPLTYGQTLMSWTLLGEQSAGTLAVTPWLALLLTLAGVGLIVLLAVGIVSRPRRDGT